MKSNIALIGMPTAGKTVLGKWLADDFGVSWLDTDHMILKSEPDLIQKYGEEHFLKIEEQVLLGLDMTGHLISTGGSAIYSEKGMKQVGKISFILYIELTLPQLLKRTEDYVKRGVIGAKDKSFEELFEEREPLYKRYADITISFAGLPTLEEQYHKLYKEIIQRDIAKSLKNNTS